MPVCRIVSMHVSHSVDFVCLNRMQLKTEAVFCSAYDDDQVPVGLLSPYHTGLDACNALKGAICFPGSTDDHKADRMFKALMLPSTATHDGRLVACVHDHQVSSYSYCYIIVWAYPNE